MNKDEIQIMILGYKSKIEEMQKLIEHLQSLNDKYKEVIIDFGGKINSIETPEHPWISPYAKDAKLNIITRTDISFPTVSIAHRGSKDYINKLIAEALAFDVNR